jgi:hypothetical protein
MKTGIAHHGALVARSGNHHPGYVASREKAFLVSI